MSSRVLDVGNCDPDFAAIQEMIESRFAAVVSRATRRVDAIAALRQEEFGLVLVNRKLDIDYTDGLEVIKAIKNDPQLGHLPCMLVTNFVEHQQQAVVEGALTGFGKDHLHDEATFARLAQILTSKSTSQGY
ncbi:MAG: hypothetical protein N2C12_06565 [Planctomycetales bacterium]